MARIQLETGFRNVVVDEYKGHQIRVVTGYHIVSDNYPIHVYVTKDGEPERKLDWAARADRLDEALDAGFAEARRAIDDGD